VEATWNVSWQVHTQSKVQSTITIYQYNKTARYQFAHHWVFYDQQLRVGYTMKKSSRSRRKHFAPLQIPSPGCGMAKI